MKECSMATNTGDRTKIIESATSASITVQVFLNKWWMENGRSSSTYVLGSMEGDDAFPDVLPGMFEFSDNGKNPYKGFFKMEVREL